MVAVLHARAGRDPSDPELTNLVGELSTQSDTFRTLWATHNVRLQGTGVKAVRHPLVGEVTFTTSRWSSSLTDRLETAAGPRDGQHAARSCAPGSRTRRRAFTTTGSNCVPALRRSSARASRGDIARR
jgi:hypothetical protein